MARTLTRLPTTQFSGLDWDNIITDVINLVTDNPSFNENWDDFLSSNAGRMLIELFAYIADQMATRVDWVANETFLGTATQKASVIKTLKIIGYNFTLPLASIVGVKIDLDAIEWAKVSPNGFYLTEAYSFGDTTWAPFSLTALDKQGALKTFELLDRTVSTGVYNYTTSVTIALDSSTKNFYEGQTTIDTFTATTDNNPIFTLNSSPVIENSVLVRLVGGASEINLTEVSSFLDPNAQREEDDSGDTIPIPYIINVDADDVVSVEFGPSSLLTSATRRLQVGQKIRALYRIGGGTDGNIPKNSIAPGTTKTLLVNKIGGGSATVTATFENPSEGTSGADGETPEHATVYAPLSIRTVEKAVTEEDYGILLEANENVITSKSYGGSNMPTDLYDLYGEYVKPMEVWNYIVPNNAEFWSSDHSELVPSEYKNFRFITLHYENRFNGIYSFTSGDFNEVAAITTSNINNGDTYIDWFGDTDYYYYQDVGLAFYDGDSISGLSYGDSYEYIINGYQYKTIFNAGDSTFTNIVSLMNTTINGDSLLVSVIGDTNSMDIRISNPGDTGYVVLDDPVSGDTLWNTFNTWSAFGDSLQVYGYGDTFYNHIIINPSSSIKNSIQNCLQGDSYFKLKISTVGDTGQQFRNIASLVVGDSLYGDSVSDTTWRIEEDINAYLRSYLNIGDGVNMGTKFKMSISFDGDTYVEVNLKDGAVDPNHVRSYEIVYNINRTFFEDASYGDGGSGDTSYGDSGGLVGVASVVSSNYVKLTSPKTGDSSKVQIKLLGDTDIATGVFGNTLSGNTGDSFICYGRKGLTVITKTGTDLGKIIYEPGTINVVSDAQNLYLHYLNGDTDSIFIGDYYYNTYGDSAVPSWRPVARRIYNSYYTTDGDSAIDATLSDFNLKFTSGDTEAMSIYVINNDWTLSLAEATTITGDTTMGDTIVVTDGYSIRLNVDGKGDTTIDITDGDSSGTYTTTQILSNMNNALQTAYTSVGTPYNIATYFSVVSNNIVIKSPVIDSASYIKLLPPASNDAFPLLFKITLGGDSSTYYPTGDYMVEYDSGQNMMKLTKTNDNQMPDLDFKCHFINDRAQEENSSTNPITEDDFEYYLSDKKVVGVEDVFKKTKFSTFDIKGTVNYGTNYTEGQVQSAIETALLKEYSLINSDGDNKRSHGIDVYRSKVLDLIHGVDGVEYVEVEYFGKDATDSSTDVTDYIDCRFDEIIVVSENKEVSNVRVHGAIFSYRVVEL